MRITITPRRGKRMKSGLLIVQLEVDAIVRYINDKPNVSVSELKQEIGHLKMKVDNLVKEYRK